MKEAKSQYPEKDIVPFTSTIEVYKFLDKDKTLDVSIATVDALLKQIAKEYCLNTTCAYAEYEGRVFKLEEYTIVFLNKDLRNLELEG